MAFTTDTVYSAPTGRILGSLIDLNDPTPPAINDLVFFSFGDGTLNITTEVTTFTATAVNNALRPDVVFQPTKITPSLTMTLRDFSARALKEYFFGTSTTVPQTTVTNELFSENIGEGSICFLAKPTRFTNLVLTTSETTPVTLVAGTDYRISDGTAIEFLRDFDVDELPIKAAYTSLASERVQLYNSLNRIYYMRIVTENPIKQSSLVSANPPFESQFYDLYAVSLQPPSEIALITEDAESNLTVEITGRILADLRRPAIDGNPLSQFGTLSLLG